ncbi:integrase arm-type DNA-binding domain-containing protein [Ancylobacter sonchi]|uniref:tyrosine-type recombinase/integrase n=1 Tax=Ancylobacter sonchi TaxID=1937790 RepID=UPI001BD4223A|nr:site-specific integrase [Ancylobacter sonchi]MBS7534261.1 integrase arm-type DNA-binding domain-containing protein [Ancylobacter sonchi]
MARNKLSDAQVKALSRPGMYSDGDGLFVRVRDGGSKQWFFVYRRGRTRTEIGLGGYGQGTAPVSVKLAREKADVIRDQLARGEDPRPGKRKVTTFKNVADDTLAVKDAALKNAKSRWQWRHSLEVQAELLHDKPIADVGVDDIVTLLSPIWQKTPEIADRLRMRVAAVIDHARARNLYQGDNPAQWTGRLQHLLPARKKLTRGHNAAAPHARIPAIMAALRAAKGTGTRAVEFQALTAARAGEVRGATWDEIDFDAELWTVPAGRMKMKREHTVPLTGRALEILRERQQVARGPLVFEGEKAGLPVSDTAMVVALRRASGDKSTINGLRSTFRDWCGDATEFPREVAEAALAHAVGDSVERAYRRGDALAKRRLLMEAWADYCSS